jgi:site-specific recombinase XerD
MSKHSVKAYGRDVMDFVRHLHAQGVDPLHVTADHVKLYRRALHEAGTTTATVARRVSVLRGSYRQLPAKGAGFLCDGAGYLRHQRRRRPEELDALADAKAGHRPVVSRSDR